ncbi:MAG TPA: hypothetical protein VF538_19110 [Pyrinomonadaceae bacterium]|jgi:hypothetical protein
MLTDEDKERIRLEELYRHEVAKELGKKKSKWEDISAFVNSAVFIWFLSSVVLGLISFAYTKWESGREDERRKHEQELKLAQENKLIARKLDAEIASRLSYFATQSMRPNETTVINKIVVGLEKPSAIDYPINVFPEYANRSLRSLLWELLQVVPDNEAGEIRLAYDKSKILYSIYLADFQRASQAKTGQSNRGLLEIIKNLLSIRQAFDLERWGKPFSSIPDIGNGVK